MAMGSAEAHHFPTVSEKATRLGPVPPLIAMSLPLTKGVGTEAFVEVVIEPELQTKK
jgi:hypothetical protein